MTAPAFPMVTRELERLARAPATYILRAVVAGLSVLAVALFQLRIVTSAQRGFVIPAEELGRHLIFICTQFHVFVFALYVPVSVAGLIASERRDQTLPILLMADIRGWDVAVSKVCAATLPAIYLLIATLPVMASGAWFGGISVVAAVIQMMLVISATFAVASIALLCSCMTASPGRAFIATLFAMGLWFGLAPFAYWIAPQAPADFVTYFAVIYALQWLQDAAYVASGHWVFVVSVALVIAILCNAATFWLIPRAAYDPPRRARRVGPVALFLRRRFPSTGSGHRIVSRSTAFGGASRSPVLRAAFIAVLFGIALLPDGFGWVAILCVLSYTTVNAAATIRTRGVLEDLMLTPLDDSALTQSLLRAGLARSAPYIPPLALSGGVYLHYLFNGTNLAETLSSESLNTIADYAMWLASYAVSGVLLISLLTMQVFFIVALASHAATYRAPGTLLSLGVMAIYGVLFLFASRWPIAYMESKQSRTVTEVGPFDDFAGVIGFSVLNLLVFGGLGLVAYNWLRDCIRTDFVHGADYAGEWTPHHYFRRGPLAATRTGDTD